MTIAKIILGSNNAYNWYAAIGEDGELVDWGRPADLVRGRETEREVMQRQIALCIANGGDWDAGWSDHDGEDMLRAALGDNEAMYDGDLSDALAKGEETALLVWGGDIEQTIVLRDCILLDNGDVVIHDGDAYLADDGSYRADGYLLSEDPDDETGPTTRVFWECRNKGEPYSDPDCDWQRPCSVSHYRRELATVVEPERYSAWFAAH